MRHPRVWVQDNPLMSFHVTADIRSCMRQPHWKMFLGAFLLVFAYWAYQVAVTGMVEVCVVVEMVIVCVVSIPMTHSVMAMEFEKATWDALVMSPLSAGQIVFGKLASRVIMLGIVFGLFLVLILLGSAKEHFHQLADALRGQCVVIGWGAFLVALTLWLSYRLRRGMAAAATAFVVQVLLLFAVPSVYPLFTDLWGEMHKSPSEGWDWMFDIPALPVNYNPVLTLSNLLHSSFHSNQVWPHLWGIWQGATYFVAALAIMGCLLRSVARATRKRI